MNLKKNAFFKITLSVDSHIYFRRIQINPQLPAAIQHISINSPNPKSHGLPESHHSLIILATHLKIPRSFPSPSGPDTIESGPEKSSVLNNKTKCPDSVCKGSSIKYNSDSLQPATPAPWHRSDDNHL